VQESQLLVHEEQKEESGPAGAEEVLPDVQASHGAQRSQIVEGQKSGGIGRLSTFGLSTFD
jgi:hypothetical protein